MTVLGGDSPDNDCGENRNGSIHGTSSQMVHIILLDSRQDSLAARQRLDKVNVGTMS